MYLFWMFGFMLGRRKVKERWVANVSPWISLNTWTFVFGFLRFRM